jgi:hypothetical protein
MDFIFGIFRSTWLKVLIYVVIGIGVNTTAPHYPQFGQGLDPMSLLHSLVQYIISVMLWPLSLWSPTFTVGKWTGL